jgi:predicted transcriptional regulator
VSWGGRSPQIRSKPLLSPIGLTVGKTDRFIVEIASDSLSETLRERHFKQRLNGVINLRCSTEDGLLDAIGKLCQDDLSGGGIKDIAGLPLDIGHRKMRIRTFPAYSTEFSGAILPDVIEWAIALYWTQMCQREPTMITRLEVNSELLQTAIGLDQEATNDTIVEKALREYIYRRQQLKEAVLEGAAAADRGELIDGETAMSALKQKLETWRKEAS